MQTLNKVFDRISIVMARISSVFLCLICLVIIINIIGRAFSAPVRGSMELVQYGMLVSVSFALCRTGFLDKHIFVPMLLNAFPKKTAAVIRFITLLITAGVFGYLVVYFLREIPVLTAQGRVTEVFRIPQGVIHGVLAFAMLVTTVMFVYQALYALRPLFERGGDTAERGNQDLLP